MVMKYLRDGAKGGIGKFILFGFLTLAVGGLVLTDVGGFFRGGTGSNNVIKVAGETVSIQEFDRSARRHLAATGLSAQDAYKIGYMQQIIGAEIREILMHKLARQSDIYITQDQIAQHIAKLLQPMTQNGQSADAMLQQILRAQGMSQREFAQAIRYEMKNALITDTLKSATAALSPHMVDALYQYQNETRQVEYLKFYDTEMEVGESTDAELMTIYESTKNRYAIPETRTIDIIQIDNDKLKDTITYSDEDLRAYYDDNLFNFENAEGEATPFEDAKADIQNLLAEEELIDQIYAIADEIEDALASGTDIQSISESFPITITTIENINSFGQSATANKTTLDAFSADLPNLARTAFDLQEGETSSLQELDDGALTAVHVAAIQPEGTYPFEEVKSQLESQWRKDQQNAQNRTRANEFFALAKEGDKTLKQIADEKDRTFRTAKNLKRTEAKAPFNDRATSIIFDASLNTPILTEIDGGLAIINVTDISLPTVTDKTRSGKTYTELQENLLQEAQNETLQTILENLHRKDPAKVNDRLLARAYGSSQ